jgi:ferredoxin
MDKLPTGVITIDLERCTGCGACVEACPTGALYLVDGRVAVDGGLCREYQARMGASMAGGMAGGMAGSMTASTVACMAACPREAISLITREGAMATATRAPVLHPEPAVVRARTWPAPVTLRSRALPMVGAALGWAGREILPWAADLLLDTLDRRAARRPGLDAVRGGGRLGRRAMGGGRRWRHRRRRGGRSRLGGGTGRRD